MKAIHLGALAAAAFALSISSSSASVTRFCGDRYCSTATAYAARTAHVLRRHRLSARHTVRSERARLEASSAERGVVRSAKTGATASVSARYRDRFQAFVDDLEAHGAEVYYMGGFRRGRCSLASQHPCGWALDVCQDYRGHVSGARDCHLPHPAEFHALARAHGLYDGSVWCSSDYGHVQARDSGGCNVAAHGSWGHGRIRLASVDPGQHRPHHHRRTRYTRQ